MFYQSIDDGVVDGHADALGAEELHEGCSLSVEMVEEVLKARVTVSTVISGIRMASGHRVKWSMQVRRFIWIYLKYWVLSTRRMMPSLYLHLLDSPAEMLRTSWAQSNHTLKAERLEMM